MPPHDFVIPNLQLSPLVFEDAELNLAISCVQYYINYRDSTEWFHIMVKIPAYPRFWELVKKEENRCITLPFSCWCDAGKEEAPRLRQHRHMIVGCFIPEHFVKKVWNKIKLTREERPHDGYRSLFLTQIESPMHLVHTLVYVSQRESQCTFSSVEGATRNNHFYLSQVLPKECKLILAMQWENGLLDYLNDAGKNLNGKELVYSPLHFANSQWRMKIKDIPGIELGAVLPVQRSFRPCNFPTPFFVHLIGGEKLYFCYDKTLCKLNLEEWMLTQAKAGNVFFHSVGEKIWIPSPAQQGLISDFKPVVDRNRELEPKVLQLERDIQTLAVSEEQCKREIETLKGEFNREMVKAENNQLQREKQELKGEFNREMVKAENNQLQREKQKLKGEKEQLKHEMSTLEGENKRQLAAKND